MCEICFVVRPKRNNRNYFVCANIENTEQTGKSTNGKSCVPEGQNGVHWENINDILICGKRAQDSQTEPQSHVFKLH